MGLRKGRPSPKEEATEVEEHTEVVAEGEDGVLINIWEYENKVCAAVKVWGAPRKGETLEQTGRRVIRTAVKLRREAVDAVGEE